MTSLIAWIGVDGRGQTSAYLASDSRISWNDSTTWDTGVKLFASYRYPEIFGYCGDITFPSSFLANLTLQIDSKLLLTSEDSIENKIDKIFQYIKDDFKNYPAKINKGFEILYFSREFTGINSKFHLSKFKWQYDTKWQYEQITLPRQSGIVNYTGSGSNSIFHWQRRWQRTEVKRTSRAVFSAFCDSINSGEDPYTGGAPQLIGLYRIGSGRLFGIIHNNACYINGKLIEKEENLNEVEWRNNLFERCDGQSMEILHNAQKQPRPSRLLS